jgi:hypothetical protein
MRILPRNGAGILPRPERPKPSGTGEKGASSHRPKKTLGKHGFLPISTVRSPFPASTLRSPHHPPTNGSRGGIGGVEVAKPSGRGRGLLKDSLSEMPMAASER